MLKLEQMIKVASKNEAVMKSLKDKLATVKGVDYKLLLTTIIDADYERAQAIEAGILSKKFSITSCDGSTIELLSEDVKATIEAIAKNYFRVKRYFDQSIDAYRAYAETHNTGAWFDDEKQICCYEYLLEEKGEYAAQQIEKALQTSEEYSVTAQFLGADRLIGTPKQQAWAEKIRSEKLHNVQDQKVLAKLLQQLAAKWWIDNKDLSIDELAKKRIVKAKASAPVAIVEAQQEAVEQTREEKLAVQSVVISEKVAQFGEDRIKADLLDACYGNQAQADAVFAGTQLMSASVLKSFLTYAQ